MRRFGCSMPLRRIGLAAGPQWQHARPLIPLPFGSRSLTRESPTPADPIDEYVNLVLGTKAALGAKKTAEDSAVTAGEEVASPARSSRVTTKAEMDAKVQKALESIDMETADADLKRLVAELKVPNVQHARVVPVSPSYFARNPRFCDLFTTAETLLLNHGGLPTVPMGRASRQAWMKKDDLAQSLGEEIKVKEYSQAMGIVHRLNRIHPKVKPDEVTALLDNFVRKINPWGNKKKMATVDRWGRAVASGGRKTARASAFVVEGTGEVQVNGKTLADAFSRVHDRETVLWPLMCTERQDKYNIFARVAGGGPTGQAEACGMAVAKALVIHEPGLKPRLRAAGCLTRDPREVERKKAGHRKARKRPAWVKR